MHIQFINGKNIKSFDIKSLKIYIYTLMNYMILSSKKLQEGNSYTFEMDSDNFST